MSLVCMPWIVCNLGGEMLYVLEQRLKAQGISTAKTARVMQDVVATMFDRGFLEQRLFVPQDTYSMASTKKIFERLAHSSIMRLSEASMDKLFDLMVTQRHLRNIRQMVAAAGATPCVDLVARAEELALSLYGRLSGGQLALMRQSLMRFFQDKRVRVSLFLSEGIQAPDGRIVLPTCTACDAGRLRVFGAGGRQLREERPPLAALQVDPNEFFCHPVPLGDNLYLKDRPRVTPPPRSHDRRPPGAEGGGGGGEGEAAERRGERSARPTADDEAAGEEADAGRQAVRELDLLAGILGGGRGRGGSGGVARGAGGAPAAAAEDNFRLNLFGEGPAGFDDDDGAGGAGGGKPAGKGGAAGTAAGGAGAARVQELEFGPGRHADYRRGLEGLSLDGGGATMRAGQDLLELMDLAAGE